MRGANEQGRDGGESDEMTEVGAVTPPWSWLDDWRRDYTGPTAFFFSAWR